MEKFNVEIIIAALPGYVVSSVNSAIVSLVSEEFSWDNLGFQERINNSRIYNLISGVEGNDLDALDITVQSVYTDNTSGDTEFTYAPSEVIYLPFIPRRYKVFTECDEFGSISNRRDNGLGYIYGDFVGEERFDFAGANMSQGSRIINDMLFLCDGSTDGRVVDLRESEGATSSLTFEHDVHGFDWDYNYKRLTTVQENAGTWYIRAISLPNEMFEADSYTFLQLNPTTALTTYDVSLTVTPPANTNGVGAVVYHNFYLYILWTLSSGNHRIVRYRITSSTIEVADAAWGGGSGYLETSTKTYKGGTYIENIFNSEDVMFLASSSGLDAIRDFNSVNPSYEGDFFSDSKDYNGIDADKVNKVLYAVYDNGVYDDILKIFSISVSGSGTVSILSDGSNNNYRGCVFHAYANTLKVYTYEYDQFLLYYNNYDDVGVAPIIRAGSDGVSAATNSIQELAVVDYSTRKITFSIVVTNCIIYCEPEDDIEYTLFQMPILNNLNVAEAS